MGNSITNTVTFKQTLKQLRFFALVLPPFLESEEDLSVNEEIHSVCALQIFWEDSKPFYSFLSLLPQIYCIIYVFFCNPHTQDVCDVFKFEFCYCYITGVSWGSIEGECKVQIQFTQSFLLPIPKDDWGHFLTLSSS